MIFLFLVILYVFHHGENHFPCIHSPGANKNTYPAQHAFVQLFTDFLVFPAFHEHLQFADIETCQSACRATGRTSPAFDT